MTLPVHHWIFDNENEPRVKDQGTGSLPYNVKKDPFENEIENKITDPDDKAFVTGVYTLADGKYMLHGNLSEDVKRRLWVILQSIGYPIEILDGDLFGATFVDDGDLNRKVLHFDGHNDYVELKELPDVKGRDDSLDIPPGWTAKFKVQLETPFKNWSSLCGSRAYSLRAVQGSQSGFTGFRDVAPAGVVGDHTFSYTPPVDQWIEMIYVGRANETVLYVDGVEVGRSDKPICLPYNYLGSSTRTRDVFKGYMAEAAFYDNAFTPDQLKPVPEKTPKLKVVEQVPDKEITPGKTLDMGVLAAGDDGSLIITIENNDYGDLEISEIQSSLADFSLEGLTSFPWVIKGGKKETFRVTYTGTVATVQETTITIRSNDHTSPDFKFQVKAQRKAVAFPEITLLANKVIIPLGNTYDFGSVKRKTDLSRDLTIKNTGKAPLEVTDITVDSDYGFSITRKPKLPFTLSPNATKKFTVTFNTRLLTKQTAVLEIANNDPQNGDYFCNVLGTGTRTNLFRRK